MINLNKHQTINILKVAIYCTLLMFIFEVLFSHSVITNWLSDLVENSKNYAYVIIWIIMFIQVCLVPIPAYVVLVGAVNTSIITNKFMQFNLTDLWFYLVVISAYMIGCLVAYFMGFKWGKKAVKWCAGNEEEYEKWSNMLNKKGKWWYALTVLFPIFPDDLLCVVAGSVKFNFWFFLICNLIGRSIGLFFMTQSLILIGGLNEGGFPWSVLCWGIALLLEIIVYIVIKYKKGGTHD